jgi:antitoxin (DNA-binding transcriptional repressor) of toxin-antitoxin stability system
MRHNVSIYEAKTQLSKLIARLSAGDEVIITNRGVPVAELKQYQAKPGMILGLAVGEIEPWDVDEVALNPDAWRGLA